MANCNAWPLWTGVFILLSFDYVSPAFVNVTTPFGVIEGIRRDLTTPDGIRYQVGLFLGIPYAKAPLGSLRFRKPVSQLSPGTFFRANEESKACPQSVFMLNGWIPGPSDMSEDCLKLNVYTPLRSSCIRSNELGDQTKSCSKKAVMIWIHGGGYVIGQSRIYNAQRLASVGDIIVVTINYRLGPFGFLSTGDGVVPGNAGLFDQHAALDWVKENIEAFGGDPKKITLSGQSAGGASSIYQLLYPENKDTIARVTLSSGTALCPWAFSRESTAKYATRLAKRVGCGYEYLPGFSVERHLKMVQCLQSKPFQEIVDNMNVGSLTETLFRAEWVPVIDGEFIKEMPGHILKWPNKANNSATSAFRESSPTSSDMSLLSDVDVMVGSTYDDGDAIAKITVRMFMNYFGVDFDDNNITTEIVEKHFFPQIIIDHLEKLKPDLISSFKSAYQESLNKSNELDDVTYTPRLEALKEILDSTTDFEFIMPLVQTIVSIANSRSRKASASQFLYIFDRKYPYLSRPDWNRQAAHGDDLPYLFGFPQSMIMAFNITEEEEKREWDSSKEVMTYWSNFVKTGNPNSPQPVSTSWQQFNMNDMNYFEFTGNTSHPITKKNLLPGRMHLWQDLMHNGG